MLELDGEGPTARRCLVQVQMVADMPGRARGESAGTVDPRVCRRYRASPAPLVRDAVRGWRVGRLERVPAGEFDLMPG